MTYNVFGGTLSLTQSVNLLVCYARDIMCEIRRLRLEQEKHTQAALNRSGGIGGALPTRNPVLMAELRGLRQRRDELERRMAGLQSSRRELMAQLEGLMHLLRAVCILLCLLWFYTVLLVELHVLPDRVIVSQ